MSTPSHPESCGGSDGGRVRAHAFTLLEVIITIALLLVLSAIALPIAMSFERRAAFRETMEHVGAGVAMARAEAQRRGVALELFAEPRQGRTVLAVRRLAAGAPAETDSEHDTKDAGEVIVEMAEGYGLSRSRPGGAVVVGETATAAPTLFVMAVFWPNGAADIGGVFYVTGDAERAAEVHINAWSGGATVQEIELVEPRDQAAAGNRDGQAAAGAPAGIPGDGGAE